MNVRIKKLVPHAVVPTYATSGSAGFDLVASADVEVPSGNHSVIPTGMSMSIPYGYVGLIFPRSGNAAKYGITLSNAVAVIDEDFRGEIKVLLHNTGNSDFDVKVGDRIAQMMIVPYPRIIFDVVDSLDDTERGDGGFGSTGSS